MGLINQCIARNVGTGQCTDYKYGRFCSKHWAQHYRGTLDINGNIIKPFRKKHSGCIVNNKECNEWVYGRFCSKHKSQFRCGVIDRNGKKLREPRWRKWDGSKCLAEHSGTGPCSKTQEGRFCKTHWNQYYKGIINFNGDKLREPLFKRGSGKCIAKDIGNCSTFHAGRFCYKHAQQWKLGIIDWNGKVLRNKKKRIPVYSGCIGGLGPCSTRPWGKFCKRHASQYRHGIIDKNGKVIRLLINGKADELRVKCGIPGCGNPAGHVWGYCQEHYEDIIHKNHYENYPSINKPLPYTMPVEKVSWNSEEL